MNTRKAINWRGREASIEDRRLRNSHECDDRVNHGDYTQNEADTPLLNGDVFVASYPNVTESKEFAMRQFRVRVL